MSETGHVLPQPPARKGRWPPSQATSHLMLASSGKSNTMKNLVQWCDLVIPSTLEAEAGGWSSWTIQQVQCQPGLHETCL